MEILKFLHSYLAYLVVITVALASINSLIGLITKKEFGAKDFRVALFGLIFTHTQVLIGIIFFVLANDFSETPMGEIMKSSALRLKNVEHPMLMLIAVILLTIGYSKHKNMRTSASKFKILTITYTLALVAILAMIPWHIWLG